MKDASMNATACPHCGSPLPPRSSGATSRRAPPGPSRYQLAAIAAEALQEKAFDETTRVRVTQQDIRNLLEKRRKGRK